MQKEAVQEQTKQPTKPKRRLTPGKYGIDVKMAAESNRISTDTIYKRIRRGNHPKNSVQRDLNIPYNYPGGIENVKKFFVDFIHLHRGQAPSLTDIVEGLDLVSTGKARNICENLRAEGWLIAFRGRHVIKDSRWLDPEEKAALDEVLGILQHSSNEVILRLVNKLKENQE